MKTRLIGFLVFLAFLAAWVIVCDGAAIPGTIVAAKITTGDTANTFSIGDTAEMGGTPKQVADAATRDAIPADRRTEGMTCWVINESNEYRLVGGILNANWVLSAAMTNVAINVFTNDGTYVHLYGTVMNVDAPYAFGRDGSFFQGTNAIDGLAIAPGSMHVLGAVSFTDSNQPTSLFIDSAVDENTLNKNFANIHGQSSASPWIVAWSLTAGESAGSTNTLSFLSHTSDPPISWGVDATNRTQLDYAGMWHSQGYFDASGIDGQFVLYSGGGRLMPTNLTLSMTTSNFYATNIYTTNLFSSNIYTTNLYVSNAYITNLTVQQITNVSEAYITNLYVSTNYTTNLFVTYANITNLYVDVAYITNLYVSTNYTTNLIFNVAKGGTVYITNALYSATNFFNEATVTNGITNLSLTVNTVLKADGGRQIASIANGTGALTNNNAGVFGWYDNYLDKSGGTVTAPVLSTSPTTNGPSATELATAGWVRSLFNVGNFFYTTTNIFASGTNVGSSQPLYEYSTNLPLPAVRSYATTDFLTNNGYIGSVIVTNSFMQLGGQIAVNAYLGFTGGGGSPSVTIHPEIYYSYDRTNWFGDFASANQSIITGQTNLYQWVVDFPAYTSTNASGFYIERRFKVGTVSGTGTRTLWVTVGTNTISGVNDASHISLPTPAGPSGVLPANAAGALTNNGTGTLGWNNNFASQPGNNAFSGNNVFSATNFMSANFTQATNGNPVVPDFSIPEQCFSTNAAFTFLAPSGVDTTAKTVQWTLVNVTNTSASAVLVTVPANCHAVGTMYLTNWGCFWFQTYGGKITNCFAIQVF